jgi:hypothetical protein
MREREREREGEVKIQFAVTILNVRRRNISGKSEFVIKICESLGCNNPCMHCFWKMHLPTSADYKSALKM